MCSRLTNTGEAGATAPLVPRRVQRRRGVALPPGAVYVGRPTRWGNPYRCAATPAARAEAVARYRTWLEDQAELQAAIRAHLAGWDLACWCPVDSHPCHADVLLHLANHITGDES